jgi:Family of unknown function (DUF5678)
MIKKNDEPYIKPWHPTPEEEKVIRESQATARWLSRLPSDILRRYRGQWIAAKDCRIIASGQTREELQKNLGSRGAGGVVVMRLEKPGRIIYR